MYVSNHQNFSLKFLKHFFLKKGQIVKKTNYVDMDIKDIKKGIQRERKAIKLHRIKKPGEKLSKILFYERRIRYFNSINEKKEFINEILLAYYDLSKTSFWQLKMDLKDVPEVGKVIQKYIKKD